MVHQVRYGNKYGAKRTEYGGYIYDSKFEASYAKELDLMKKGGAILDWDRQFKVEMWACDHDGQPVFKKTHKVDFRIHHKDGSFELVECKGVETQDWRDRKKWLEKLWLPAHKDHTYTVIKQAGKSWRRTF